MNAPDPKPTCPHCGAQLKALRIPNETGWEQEYHLVCFNNDCGYFTRGWQHMLEQFAQHKSYRFRINPETGKDSPIPVWSETALVNFIIDEDEA